jgi:hypothetical protein
MPDGLQSRIALQPAQREQLHRRLNAYNHARMSPGLPTVDWRREIAAQAELLVIEGDFLEEARAEVSEWAADAPHDADGFVEWFSALEQNGPGQSDPLFPWIAEVADMEAMRWFLTQEVAGEAGFDDLSALTQVRMPVRAKLEIARNYWDEMGRGNPKGMHGPMLELLSVRLGLTPDPETTVWEALALANTMAGLAANRRYAYHSVGALGIIEQTAPTRAAQVANGLKRLGVANEDRHYFDLHSVLDVKHSLAWNAEAIHPLVESDPALAQPIAEGALMRLQCGAACFERYRNELGLN